MNLQWVDVSNVMGLIALGTIALNLILGLSLWGRIRFPMPKWLPLLKAHKLTGYAAAIFIVLHVTLIPLISDSGFRWRDLLLPLWTRHQPYMHSLGALAFYLLAVVIISSYYKKRMRYALWRRLHYLSYGAAPLLLVHGLFSDPAVKDKAIDYLDGEKVFVEACALIFLVLTAYRIWTGNRRHHPAKQRSHSALLLCIAGGLLFSGARAMGSDSAIGSGTATGTDTAKSYRFDPDSGFAFGTSRTRIWIWGYGQGAIGNEVDPYFHRVRQGAEWDLLPAGPVRPALVYEADFTDNDFFRQEPAWKVWENAFLAVQDKSDAGRFRLLYGENTHILSQEDNQPSGNLTTVNRSIILESHGSIHTFGTQWGGQMQALVRPTLQIALSAGDNRGSLNQDHPHFSAANDWAAKAIWHPWSNARGGVLTIGTAIDWTRQIYSRPFQMGTTLTASKPGQDCPSQAFA